MSAIRTELEKIIRCLEKSVNMGLRSNSSDDAMVRVPARIAIPMLYLVLWAVDGLETGRSQWSSHLYDLFGDMEVCTTNTSVVQNRVKGWIDQVVGRDFTSLYLVGLEAKQDYRQILDGDFSLNSGLLLSMLKVALDQAKTLQRETLFSQNRLRFWMDK